MAEPLTTSYDEIPYAEKCFPFTHPDHLATVARLYGLEPPSASSCRLLELGCAGGGNLIPMALSLPRAHFLGVDLSQRQVAAGRQLVERLGLENVELRAASLSAIGPDDGRFDYIVCHGVYSWVPEPVREKILAICAENLADDGVAYVSYNTLPGWHGRGMVRELMLYHVRRLAAASPLDQVEGARAFLGELVSVLPEPGSAFGRILRVEDEYLRGVGDSYLYHEHLEETNHPIYVHEFLARAAAHDLAYIAEAGPGNLIYNLPEPARQAIAAWAGPDDRPAREQYADFLTDRTFRRSLLCHARRRPTNEPQATVLTRLHVVGMAGPAEALDEADISSERPIEFRGAGGSPTATTLNPLVKATLLTLFQHRPRALPFDSIRAEVRALLSNRPDLAALADNPETLSEVLLRCYFANLVGLFSEPPRFALEPAERPVASPLARIQAADDEPVLNLRHRSVRLNEFERLVLRLLDGTRDRAALLDSLERSVLDETFSILRDGLPLRDPAEIRRLLSVETGPCLDRLAREGLLME